MKLKDYFQQRMDEENKLISNYRMRYKAPKTAGEIVDFYRTYDGLKRQMRALNSEQVEEYMANGYAFACAYLDNKLAGVVASKQFPEDYPYFHLPKNEPQGVVNTLGGLYVNKKYSGLGIASKLAEIATQATQEYSQKEENFTVGMAYEVSYDNNACLRILGKQGNFAGYYSDTAGKEGLSILLYKPFLHQPVEIENPNIILTSEEQSSQISLAHGLQQIANQPQVGGFEVFTHQLDDGNIVTTNILNTIPKTVSEHTFEVNS